MRHLQRNYNFTGSLVETAPKSLRHSCRSELRVSPPFPEAQTIPSPWPSAAKGRRLITAMDLPPRRQRLRSHVPKDDQSLRGQSSTRSAPSRTSHGITFSRHDVLEASHTRKASPLLAGYCTKSLSHRAIRLPDKEFRYLRQWPPMSP